MGVIDGQAVDQSITNAAYINKNQNDSMPNILGLSNPYSATISDIQAAANRLYTATGATDAGGTGTAYNAAAGTITNGQNYQTALGILANKFAATTGHMHTGASGDGPVLQAANLGYTTGNTALMYQGTTVGGMLNFANPPVYGTRSSPIVVPASGGLIMTAGYKDQYWYVRAAVSGGMAVSGTFLSCTGFSVGQLVEFTGCSDAFPLALGGALGSLISPSQMLLAGPIILGLSPTGGQNCVLGMRWDGSNLQEIYRT